MKWAFVIIVLLATSSATKLSKEKRRQIQTLKNHIIRNDREVRRTFIPTKWDHLVKKQVHKIRKLINDVKSENGPCPKDFNAANYCKIHWLPDTLLRLSVRLDSKKKEHKLKTDGEKKILEKNLKIKTLMENMLTVTGYSKEKKKTEKQEEKRQKGLRLSKTNQSKDKGGGKKTTHDANKDEENKSEKEDAKTEDKDNVGATGGQTKAETADKVNPPEVAEETPVPESDSDDDLSAKSSDEDKAEEASPESKEKCDYSNFGESHTMLLPTSDCKIHRIGLEDGDKEEILRLHNNLRAKVARGEETEGNPGPQPPAANMRELVWNDQLAEVAEAWARQCKQGHDQAGARKICSRNYFVGQNLHFYYGSSPTIDWETAVNDWYKEVSDMPNEIASAFRPLTPVKIGHYTQVVWGDTNEVGCGIVHYETEIDGRFFPESKLYACNYGPAGNTKTLPMYVDGPAASQCPNGISKNYPDLCA